MGCTWGIAHLHTVRSCISTTSRHGRTFGEWTYICTYPHVDVHTYVCRRISIHAYASLRWITYVCTHHCDESCTYVHVTEMIHILCMFALYILPWIKEVIKVEATQAYVRIISVHRIQEYFREYPMVSSHHREVCTSKMPLKCVCCIYINIYIYIYIHILNVRT